MVEDDTLLVGSGAVGSENTRAPSRYAGTAYCPFSKVTTPRSPGRPGRAEGDGVREVWDLAQPRWLLGRHRHQFTACGPVLTVVDLVNEYLASRQHEDGTKASPR